MSSFIGVFGENTSVKEQIRELVPDPDFSFQNESLFVACDLTLNSTHFKEYSYYDFRKVENLIHQFYLEKNYSLVTQLSWFINFEILRQKTG